MTSSHTDVIVGIDTHADTHHVAVIDATGAKVSDAGFPATGRGYEAILAFISAHGTVRLVGVEGTHSYGAGITVRLKQAGLEVVEIIRPARQARRRGKSDPIDAYAAAAAALSRENHPQPKATDGAMEAIRYLHVARRSAVKARSAAMIQLKTLLVTAPERLRTRYRRLSDIRLVNALARCHPITEADRVARTILTAMKSLAIRHRTLGAEISELETSMKALLEEAAPALLAAKGVGIISAAQLLITAGENSDRLRSEASFAALCGTNPIPASSGKTTRHRLNRGGDRDANAALHHIALNRLACDGRTREYVERKRQDGKGTMEALRCLKRAIARETYKLITHPEPVIDYRILQPLRKELGLIQATAAAALGVSLAKVSLIENGRAHDSQFTAAYHRWLTQQQNLTS